MGKIMRELLERDKALELAREVEKVKEDMTNQLDVQAVTRLVSEQYKKSCSNAGKHKEQPQTFKDIIPLGTDLDNNEIYDIKTGQTIKDI